jgi:apolipoprotein N-acyltransferase
MKKARIFALGTILAASFALGVQAKAQTTGITGDGSNYEIGQPDSTSQQSDVAKDQQSSVAKPDQQTTTEPEKQNGVTPALPTEVETLDQNWNPPAHL